MRTDDVLAFIKRCFRQRKIGWTYHVNMRLAQRRITRDQLLAAVETFEIIEGYQQDRFLPCYLLFGKVGDRAIHVVVAVDEPDDNVRIVTAYEPDPIRWDVSLKIRRDLN